MTVSGQLAVPLQLVIAEDEPFANRNSKIYAFDPSSGPLGVREFWATTWQPSRSWAQRVEA